MDPLLNSTYTLHPTNAVSSQMSKESSPLKASLAGVQADGDKEYNSMRSDLKLQKTGLEPPQDKDQFLDKSKAHVSSSHQWLNFTLAFFWVGPLVTVYWCNTWHIPENYLFPEDPVTSSWLSGALGYSAAFAACFLQRSIAGLAVRLRAPLSCFVMLVYSYVMGWASIHQWRCVWVLLDIYTGAHLLNAGLSLAVASTIMLFLRVHRTIASTPSTVRMDLPIEDHFTVLTYFEVSTGFWLKAADSLFTVIIVDTVGICVWRGLWEVLDFGLEPDDKAGSGLWTLVISYGLAIVLFFTQGFVQKLSIVLEDKHWLVSIAFEDFITILHSIVTVTHWRGFWTLMDVYLPYKPVSHWVCHFASFFLLSAGLAANAIPVLGCSRDGRVRKGEGIHFDNYYFTHLQELWTLHKTKTTKSTKSNLLCQD